MTDAVSISNMAISHVGANSTIESLTEDSPEAKAANIWYNPARRQTLKAYNWNFARKRQTLAAHGDAPPLDRWAYRYRYPADALAIRELENPGGRDADAVPYTVEMSDDGTKSILTNMQTAKAVYTFDQQSAALFSENFVSILARLMAHYIAPALTGKRRIAELQLNIWQQMITFLPAQDANEGMDEPARDAEWVRDR